MLLQYRTQHNTTQHSIPSCYFNTEHNTTQHNRTQHNTALRGLRRSTRSTMPTSKAPTTFSPHLSLRPLARSRRGHSGLVSDLSVRRQPSIRCDRKERFVGPERPFRRVRLRACAHAKNRSSRPATRRSLSGIEPSGRLRGDRRGMVDTF